MSCECGHDAEHHHRIVISVFPCNHCTCSDFAEQIPDDASAEDFEAIFKRGEQ
jgi:hypothetical protein